MMSKPKKSEEEEEEEVSLCSDEDNMAYFSHSIRSPGKPKTRRGISSRSRATNDSGNLGNIGETKKC
jgi:hypothetical protein